MSSELRIHWALEARRLSRGSSAWVVVVALAVAVAGAYANGVRWAGEYAQTAVQQQSLEETWKARQMGVLEAWERERRGSPPHTTDPSVLGGAATGVYLPSPPLGVLGAGDTDLYPRRARVAMWMRRAAQFESRDLHNPVHLLVGRLDVTFVAIYLYPLILIAAMYGLLSIDRSYGVLTLTLSQPVRLRKLLMARAVWYGLLAAVLPTVVLIATPLVAEPPIAWGRLLTWGLIVWCYGLFWVALATAVNARSHAPARNAMLLVGAWLLSAIVLPSGLALVVERLHPVPSRVPLALALRQAEHDAIARSDALLERHYRDHPNLAPSGEDPRRQDKIFIVRAIEVDRQLEPLLMEFETRVAERKAAARRYSFLSPALLAQAALSEIAGTDHRRFAAFREQVRRFQHAWAERYRAMVFAGAVATVADWEARPTFAFVDEAPAALVGRGLTMALYLLAMALMPGVVASVRSRQALR